MTEVDGTDGKIVVLIPENGRTYILIVILFYSQISKLKNMGQDNSEFH